MKSLHHVPIIFGILILLFTNNIVIHGQDNGRIIDIRQIVKDTLDYVRTVPAPEPFKSMIYNPTFNQQHPQVSPIVTGQNLPIGPGQVFAPPSKNDVDKLFHLPADIFEKLASDAGYIPEKKPIYSNYKETSQVLANPSPSLGGFNFNVANGNGKQQTMEEIIEQLQVQASKSQSPQVKAVTDNIQIEPIMTTTLPPTTTEITDNKKIEIEKVISNTTTNSQINNNNNNFDILSEISNILAANKINESSILNLLTSTPSTSSFLQQPEKINTQSSQSPPSSTSPPPPYPQLSNNFDLHGQEIILNGQKYILTKPTSTEEDDNAKNNFLLKEKTSEEVKVDDDSKSNSFEYTSNEKESNYQKYANGDEEKTNDQVGEDETKVTTSFPDNTKEVTADVDPITKKVTSESGSFVQFEVVNEKETPSTTTKTTTNLPKNLESLLMEQLEKEQLKGAEEQRKFLLRQRTLVDDNSLPNIFLINEDDEVKGSKPLTPISIRKLNNITKKKISIGFEDSVTEPPHTDDDRVELLRKSFNEQRRILAFKSRQLFSRNRLNKNSQPFLAVTFCQKLDDMAKEIGSNDIVEMAEENCKLITNYYPDLTCNEVLQYAEHCLLLMKLEKKN